MPVFTIASTAIHRYKISFKIPVIIPIGHYFFYRLSTVLVLAEATHIEFPRIDSLRKLVHYQATSRDLTQGEGSFAEMLKIIPWVVFFLSLLLVMFFFAFFFHTVKKYHTILQTGSNMATVTAQEEQGWELLSPLQPLVLPRLERSSSNSNRRRPRRRGLSPLRLPRSAPQLAERLAGTTGRLYVVIALFPRSYTCTPSLYFLFCPGFFCCLMNCCRDCVYFCVDAALGQRRSRNVSCKLGSDIRAAQFYFSSEICLGQLRNLCTAGVWLVDGRFHVVLHGVLFLLVSLARFTDFALFLNL